jgi:hypothetical protein
VNFRKKVTSSDDVLQTHATGNFTQLNRSFKQQARENKPCFLEVYISNIGGARPGHVSTSMIAEGDDGMPELLTHTSYMPMPGAASLNFASLLLGAGSTPIPVPAENYQVETIRKDDVGKADTILRIPVTFSQLRRGIIRQIALAEGVDEGRYMYSVIGAATGFSLAGQVQKVL